MKFPILLSLFILALCPIGSAVAAPPVAEPKLPATIREGVDMFMTAPRLVNFALDGRTRWPLVELIARAEKGSDKERKAVIRTFMKKGAVLAEELGALAKLAGDTPDERTIAADVKRAQAALANLGSDESKALSVIRIVGDLRRYMKPVK